VAAANAKSAPWWAPTIDDVLPYASGLAVCCERCSAPALLVLVGSREVLVEPRPIEYPVVVCPACHNNPQHRPICQRCRDAGVVGEPTPWSGIAVGERGQARRWSRFSERAWGEGLYRLHWCR
jgi:hypothetical protein